MHLEQFERAARVVQLVTLSLTLREGEEERLVEVVEVVQMVHWEQHEQVEEVVLVLLVVLVVEIHVVQAELVVG